MMVEDVETLQDLAAKYVKVLAAYIGFVCLLCSHEMLKKESIIWHYTVDTNHLATEAQVVILLYHL